MDPFDWSLKNCKIPFYAFLCTSTNIKIRQSTIWYAGSLILCDKWLIDEAFDVLRILIIFYRLKGQLKKKKFFGVVDFLQKTNESKSTWGIIAVKSNLLVCFLEEIDEPKNHFEINWPLPKVYTNVKLYILTLSDIYCLVTTVLSFSRGGYLEKAC